MMKTDSANLNLLWATLLIEEFYRFGVTQACIAPGSRSTPLTMAAALHTGIECHPHFDERGLGFYALGMAKSRKEPVLLICTSGTAVANLYPAVIEAYQTGVPLIILAGDRPPELIGSGANQAIQQGGIFANYPVYQNTLPTPELAVSPSQLLTTVAQLRQTQLQQPGPAYLNCPFREPFYPDDACQDYSNYLIPVNHWLDATEPFTQINPISQCVTTTHDWTLWAGRRGVIVIGAQSHSEETQAIVKWAQQLSWPILADVQSQAFGMTTAIHGVDTLLRCPQFQQEQPDLILQFGGFIISKTLLNWIDSRTAPHWYIAASHHRHDPSHRLSQRWNCQARDWLAAHPPATQCNDNNFAEPWLMHHSQLMQAQSESLKGKNDEVAIVHQLAALIPQNSQLMIGNSLPIRSMQWVGGHHFQADIEVFANRGASGIDGLVATAMGCAASGTLTTLIIGDTSLLYDLNSLALSRNSQGQMIIVVINNDGGNIFDLLPGPGCSDLARDFYQMPHQMDFHHAAQQFGLAYRCADSSAALIQYYNEALHQSGHQLIEVKVASHQATEVFRQLGELAGEYSPRQS